MGGGTMTVKATKIEALKLQSSTYGVTIPTVFGVTRVAGNLVWYDGFTAHKHKKTQSAGKGGAKTKTITYTYTAHVAMAIAEGTIIGVPRVWRGKEKFLGGIPAANILTATETYTVPGGGGAKTVSNSASWKSTSLVWYTGAIEVGDGSTSGPIYLA